MKVVIDKFYTENYDLLVLCAKRRIAQLKRSVEPESLVSSSYLYLVNKKDLKEEDIEKLAFGFIYFELIRSMSQTNLKERVTAINTDFDIVDSNQSEQLLLKIDIADFVKSLDRLDKIIWKVYFELGKMTKRELAAHFNIDPSSALIYINAIKTKLKHYVEDKEKL